MIPVITIQNDWNEVIRIPNKEAWISLKYLNQNSIHDKLKTYMNENDGKITILLPDAYQYITHSILSLNIKHIPSGLKVSFVACSKLYNVHDKGILSVNAAANALVVSSSEEDKLLIWDSRTSEVILNLKGHGGPVYKCRFFPSGIVVLTAGADGSCKIWSAETGVNPVTLVGHAMSVADLAIIDKGRNIISVSRDGTAKLWDVGESRCLANVLEGHGPINCCCITTISDEFHVDNEREVGTGNKLVVVGCESGLVLCAHVAKREQVFSHRLESACNSCIVIQQTVILGCSDGKIIQLNLQDGSIIKEFHESASPVLSLCCLQGATFSVGRQDGTCTIISLDESYALVRVVLTGPDCDGIRDISFNGKWLFTGCRDSNIRKYDFNQVAVHFK